MSKNGSGGQAVTLLWGFCLCNAFCGDDTVRVSDATTTSNEHRVVPASMIELGQLTMRRVRKRFRGCESRQEWTASGTLGN